MTFVPITGKCPVCHNDSENSAFQAGAASERIITLQDDDSLRFIKRVLEGAHQTDSDKMKCLEMLSEIRTRIRGGYTDE